MQLRWCYVETQLRSSLRTYVFRVMHYTYVRNNIKIHGALHPGIVSNVWAHLTMVMRETYMQPTESGCHHSDGWQRKRVFSLLEDNIGICTVSTKAPCRAPLLARECASYTLVVLICSIT